MVGLIADHDFPQRTTISRRASVFSDRARPRPSFKRGARASDLLTSFSTLLNLKMENITDEEFQHLLDMDQGIGLEPFLSFDPALLSVSDGDLLCRKTQL